MCMYVMMRASDRPPLLLMVNYDLLGIGGETFSNNCDVLKRTVRSSKINFLSSCVYFCNLYIVVDLPCTYCVSSTKYNHNATSRD